MYDSRRYFIDDSVSELTISHVLNGRRENLPEEEMGDEFDELLPPTNVVDIIIRRSNVRTRNIFGK